MDTSGSKSDLGDQIPMDLDSSEGLLVASDNNNNCPSSYSCDKKLNATTATTEAEPPAQLPAAERARVAANAKIRSKRKTKFTLELNPSIRRRQYNRLLRKLKQTVNEFSTRVGQQAVILVATPEEPTNWRVFGARPLEDVVKKLRCVIVSELQEALIRQANEPQNEELFELPPLRIEGVPTPVHKMTQAQLRAFIPFMLRYSTGRGKPGWGCASTRPPWWPDEVPWANVRMDVRHKDQKLRVPWTQALQELVRTCYKYHGREDLLPTCDDKCETDTSYEHIIIEYASEYADVTVSTEQCDPHPHASPDGTTALAVGCSPQREDITAQIIHADSEDSAQDETATISKPSINIDGQIVYTDGINHVNGIVAIPVSGSTIYQNMSMFGNTEDVTVNQESSSSIIKTLQVPKIEPSSGHMEQSILRQKVPQHSVSIQSPVNNTSEILPPVSSPTDVKIDYK